jgi:catecholate siderophore receptor
MAHIRSQAAWLLGTTALAAIGQGSAAQAQSRINLETIEVQSTASGTVGYLATRSATATKTDTPPREIPQSITVVTKQQVQDIAAQRLEDVVRYVPGINWHQGENNRDQIVIRGQSSTADFFVNGMRDDGQVFRDLYNIERIEFLKGPNAMIFGRGGAGGVLNRVLKEADGLSINEWRWQTGSYDNKRVAGDVGGKINETLFARFNAVFEDTNSYRDFFHMRRFGLNPTATWLPTPNTRVKLSYEHFEDRRTANRGIPSQNGLPYFPASPSTFFGNPLVSFTPSVQNIATAVIEHDFDSGLKVKSQTRFADTKRFYQNVYPGSAVSPATGTFTLAAYNNQNDRQNLLNQTDWTVKLTTGSIKHTVLFGTEFGQQKSANARFTGFFGNGTTASNPIPASNPVSFEQVRFLGLATDNRNRTNLNLAAVYAQEQMEVTRWLQFIGGLRFDRFDLSYINLNGQSPAAGQTFARVDNLISPRIGAVVKPVEPVSLYASYSVSYLPASGDQFGALTVITTGLKPEQFINKEVGVKWDVTPALMATGALFRLDRQNTPIRDNTQTVIAAGQSRVDGLELSLAGRVTEKWQITAGYANLDARFLTDTSNAAGTLAARAGNRVPFTPVHTYSLWNRYDFSEMWGVGLGVISQTEYFANADNQVHVPGFTRVDGAIFWRLNTTVRAQVNVENIFGVKYYPSADSNNNITIGAPRTVRLVLTTSFDGVDRPDWWRPTLPASVVR